MTTVQTFEAYQLGCEKQRKDKEMSYEDEMDTKLHEEMDKEINKEIITKVWDDAIADTERKIEGYKRRIAALRSALRIMRDLKKKNAANKEN